MPVIEMPDGTPVDIGDNPSPKVKAAVAAKYKEILATVKGAGEKKPEVSAPEPQVSTQAASTPATTTPPPTAVNPDIGQIIQNRSFDPGGSAHASAGTEEIVQGVKEKQGMQELKSLAARTVLPMAGGLVGSAIGGPAGGLVGAGVGAAAGDWIAQDGEIETGIRQAFNPWRTAAETFTAGYLSKFDAAEGVAMAVGKGALVNMGSDTLVSLAEGNGLPSTFELAVSALSGGIMSGGTHKISGMYNANRSAIKEISGSDEVANRVADFMGPTRAGEQLGLDLKPKPQMELPLKPGEPIPELVGPTRDITKPKLPTLTKKQYVERQRLTDEQMTHQMGFDDVEEGHAFHDLMNGGLEHGQQKLDLGVADNSTRPWKISEIGPSEQDEWARMKATARGKSEQLVDPLSRDTKFGDVSDFTKMMTVTGRPKDVFRRIEDETQLPVYQDYHNLSQAQRKAQMEVTKDNRVVTAALAKTSDPERQAIMQAFVKGGDFTNLPYRLRSKAADLWSVADKQLQEYGLSAEDYFGKYVPEILSGKSIDQIIQEGQSPAAVGKRLNYLAEDINDDWLSPQDPSLVRTMGRLVDLGNYRKHVGDLAVEVGEKYNGNTSLRTKQSGQPNASLQYINTYLRSLKGANYDPGADKISRTLGYVASKLPGDMDGRELANNLIKWSYSGLLGLRPGAMLRNAMQSIQTGIPIFGPKAYAAGLKRTFTAEGKALAEARGIIGVDTILKAEGTGGKFSELAMAPYQKIEDFNRTVSYLSGNAKFESALKKIGGPDVERTVGAWTKLADKADIDRLSRPEQGVLARMWDEGASMDDIKHIYSQGIVDDTQFMYMPSERAQALQTLGGRTMFGFSNWPLSYASYMARLGYQGPPRKRVRDIIRFAATNGAILTAFTEMGHQFGDKDSFNDNLGWTFMGPLAYSGMGPIPNAVAGLAQAANEVLTGRAGGRYSNLETVGRTVSGFVPAGAEVYDIVKAAGKSKSQKELIGRLSGFRRGK